LDPAITGKVLDRLRNGASVDPVLEELNEQELRILELISEGLTNREIAERIYLAEKTVKNYVSNMLRKMGMTRRAEAAAYQARAGERDRRRSGR
jgi:DNA-binding NarL/FixJ family response regulator